MYTQNLKTRIYQALLLAIYMKNYLSGKDYTVGLETVVQVAFGELVVSLSSSELTFCLFPPLRPHSAPLPLPCLPLLNI